MSVSANNRRVLCVSSFEELQVPAQQASQYFCGTDADLILPDGHIGYVVAISVDSTM